MDLADKIHKIEALIVGTTSEGERRAAEFAKQRLLDKIVAQPIEYTVRANSSWEKRLFVALCQKHGLKTYRYARQKYTTTMLRVSKPFMEQVLWPEFSKHSAIFGTLAGDIMNDLISKIHQVDDGEETVIMGEIPMAASAL